MENLHGYQKVGALIKDNKAQWRRFFGIMYWMKDEDVIFSSPASFLWKVYIVRNGSIWCIYVYVWLRKKVWVGAPWPMF